jgi:hypothetical protein
VCAWLSWRQPNGTLREVSCRVALRELERRGVITLPVSRRTGRLRQGDAAQRCAPAPPEVLLECAPGLPTELRQLGPIELVVVGKHMPQDDRVWKQAIERFHPAGYVPLPQAHVRYLIRCRYGVLGALGFSAAARHLRARDEYVGWSVRARVANREMVVCNSRFLLLPWVKIKDLASHVLAQAARHLAHDWQAACGLKPVLLETYVDPARYRASCYRGAGWQRVGASSGRTRNDRQRATAAAVRDIYLLPLCSDYRQRLCREPIRRKPSATRGSWAHRELQGAELGDPRRLARLERVLEAFYARPNASVPQACGPSWAAIKGAYRLLSHQSLSIADILAPHYSSTVERMGERPVVLAVQDTTSLNYSAHPATSGLGTIGSDADGALGLEVHSTLAITPGGLPLGLIDVQAWARDGDNFGKKHSRRKRPIEDKESYKWLASFEAAAHAQRLCPQTQVVSVGDREADVFELFELTLSRHDHPALLVRASQDRRVGGATALLWQSVESQPRLGIHEIHINRTATRAAREARLSIHACAVELRPPLNGPSGRAPLRLWAILAREEHAPEGATALEWLLLTTIETRTCAEAIQKLDWYAQRWGIEVFHRTFKTGCQIEDRQFGTATGLLNCLGVDMIVAWRILYLTRLGREVPDIACTAVFTDDEWQSLCRVSHPNKPVPSEPPALNDAILMVAKLGGYIGRNADGPPGVEPIWIGLTRLFDISMCWRLFGPAARAP